MRESPPVRVKVWGEFACFTRPEMKVERVSYPVMTPSAARGVLEAIFWKPEMQWRVMEIAVLKNIRHASTFRNEVNSRVPSNIAQWATKGGNYLADEDRAQRHTLALRDVAYLVTARIVLPDETPFHVNKYVEMFGRRLMSGKCFHRPYLGCREFIAHFGMPDGTERPIDIDDELGLMLFDLDYQADKSGRGTPKFFAAQLDGGVLRVPQELYPTEVRRAAQSAG